MLRTLERLEALDPGEHLYQYRNWLNEARRKGDERRRDEQTVHGLNERFKHL